MELIHESQKNADSSSLFVSLKQIPIKEKDNLSNESSFETVPGQGDRLIHDNETNPVDPVFHGNPDPKLWPGFYLTYFNDCCSKKLDHFKIENIYMKKKICQAF